jgi:hypothetical protein
MTDPFDTPQRRPDPYRTGAPRDPAAFPATPAPPPPVTEPIPPVTPVPPTPAPGSGAGTGAPGTPVPPVPSGPYPDQTGDRSTTDQAKDAAQSVASDAQDAARSVRDTARDEASSVKDDTVREARKLWDETSSTLGSQASDQLNRTAETVRGLSDDLGRMARGEKPEPGLATDLADQLNSRADAAATWLENHEPADVLHEVQSFARRRPVAFLAIAAGVGFVAGRVTRGMVQNRTDDALSGSDVRSGPVSGGAAPRPAGTTPPAPGTGTGPAAAPLSGTHSTGAPAYGAPAGGTTPGYSERTDPYGGEAR